VGARPSENPARNFFAPLRAVEVDMGITAGDEADSEPPPSNNRNQNQKVQATSHHPTEVSGRDEEFHEGQIRIQKYQEWDGGGNKGNG